MFVEDDKLPDDVFRKKYSDRGQKSGERSRRRPEKGARWVPSTQPSTGWKGQSAQRNVRLTATGVHDAAAFYRVIRLISGDPSWEVNVMRVFFRVNHDRVGAGASGMVDNGVCLYEEGILQQALLA